MPELFLVHMKFVTPGPLSQFSGSDLWVSAIHFGALGKRDGKSAYELTTQVVGESCVDALMTLVGMIRGILARNEKFLWSQSDIVEVRVERANN